MNKKEVTGTTQQIKGKAEHAVGNVTGNQNTQAQGTADEMQGKTTKTIGTVERKVDSIKADVKG
jgi:uncharacterized protein YjbJ (UPF0337 family)